ncbi:MAG: SDR family oxidoreductase [Chloroflexi bacterium AL-W]|nr:SDR family oxidoreductase [Chloroflexi bacterium AL-N1]NOK68310.1 SDR family oxidoreductase [Chloroflexi bacterium AL-N10]NOK73956.1 SDR family oxidoreductase [Chloroflexi bacterium AL-N5]NOK82924.1 SDR family oxidoreductase [Chloroflexi bacterium AL-W]NOK90446.1 SDR family oxidoreductase [Chloroflexi bacterium AL-N15]
MKLLIFGATGGTGNELVRQALEQGHTVTAFIRNPTKLDRSHANLYVVQGDVMDFVAVTQAMYGQDVVLSALGAPPSNQDMVRTNGTRMVIRAMEQAGIRRFICQSSLGFADSRNMLPLHMKYVVVPLILRHAFADHEAQEQLIKQSQLEWIIVRSGTLTDNGFTGTYRHGFDFTDTILTLKISRTDTADFMLKQVTDTMYLYKTVGLSY